MEHNIINNQVNDYTLLNTVDRKKAYFPQREFKEADRSRIMQQLVGEPSIKTLKEAVEKNQIRK